MSPFMSSMPCAGLIEMPPVSKHTPLPMKATGGSPFLPPFQRMTTTRLSCAEPCPTPSSAFMPSFFIAGTSSTSTATPSFFKRRRAAGELLRIKHIGGLVDEVARHDHAVGDRLIARSRPFARADGVGDRDRDARGRRRLLALLALGLVAIERVGAQLHAEREIGGLVGLERPAGQFGKDRRPRSPTDGIRPMAAPPSLTKSCGLSLPALPTPITIRRVDRQARRARRGRAPCRSCR